MHTVGFFFPFLVAPCNSNIQAHLAVAGYWCWYWTLFQNFYIEPESSQRNVNLNRSVIFFMALVMRFFLLFHIHLLRAVKPCFEEHPKVFNIQIRTARVADSDSRTTGRGFLFSISHIIISIINYKKKLAKVRGDFLSIKLLELLVMCLVSCTHFTWGAYTSAHLVSGYTCWTH